MRGRRLLGWRGAALGVGCLLLGVWAVIYACNTETASCKGVRPWPAITGLMYRAGWVAAILGLTLAAIAVVGWITRAIIGREPRRR